MIMTFFIILDVLLLAGGAIAAILGGEDTTVLVFGIIACVIGIFGLKEQLKFKKIDSKVKKHKQERENAISSGKWDFPWRAFYEECKNSGFVELNSTFSEAKAKAIADVILKKNIIPEQFFNLYDNREKLQEYLEYGRNAEIQEKVHLEEEKERPQHAELTEEQAETVRFHSELMQRYGKEKREVMLNYIISTYLKKITSVKKAKESIQTMGVILANSASETKTANWATMAGIANGLAGPVAGALTGIDVMAKNAQIEEQNRRNREAVNQAAAQMIAGSSSLNSDIWSLEKEKAVFDKAKEELGSKVVLDGIDEKELFDSLNISNIQIVVSRNHVLKISVKLSSQYHPDGVPNNVRTTIDGTLTGMITAGDLRVGEICLPLPLFGVECGNTEGTSADTICEYYAINDKPYDIKFRPNKLWVMEV